MEEKIVVLELQPSTLEAIEKFGPKDVCKRFHRMADKATINNVPSVSDQYRKEAILIAQQYGIT